MDFSITTYIKLLQAFKRKGFIFLPVTEFVNTSEKPVLCLRQDVDILPANSLRFARIQHELGIRSTFYFRIVNKSWDEDIIREIHELGHEIGYHYEDLSLVNSKTISGKEDLFKSAILSFEQHLDKLRKIVPVSTICMHGRPLSPLDSKLLWKYYNYKDFEITAEPYFDVDFSEVLYLTDTGRRWNGDRFSVRDKLSGKDQKQNESMFSDWEVYPSPDSSMNLSPESKAFQDTYRFRTTTEIIRSVDDGNFPDSVMMTFHPQRWTSKALPWVKELILQNLKNIIKYFLIKFRD